MLLVGEARHVVVGLRLQRAADQPPFGVNAPGTAPSQAADQSVGVQSAGGQSGGSPAQGALPFEIRDRLIELDDLRRRGILSEEEFAAKKSELLNRI